ncbi:MAG TPA: hypothetical protein VN933_07245, partial [Candidatus Eremiobacteraceae bacterium]|nr:hypothetical protein [Candidatus Eremiobacteraceae bacterium]
MNANQRGGFEGCAADATGTRLLCFVASGLVCLLLLAGLCPVAGAATTAGISGVVTDQTGAAVV